jgi:uncharacterized protein (TIGR00369 family)
MSTTPSEDQPATLAPPASWGEPRSKVVTWFDPIESAKAGMALSGADFLTGIIEGRLPPPPIAAHFETRLESIGEGEATFVCTPDESAYNPIGMIHGGFVCTLLDSALGCAVQTQLPAGVGYTSIDITISYLRAVHAGRGEVRAIGRVTKPGRRVAFGEAKLVDEAGKTLATATGSCLIMGPS